MHDFTEQKLLKVLLQFTVKHVMLVIVVQKALKEVEALNQCASFNGWHL